VKEPTRIASNWRHENTLDSYLTAQNIVGLCDIDTRALVRHLRTHGALRGVIAPTPEGGEQASRHLVAAANEVASTSGQDLAQTVSCKEPYVWQQGTCRISNEAVVSPVSKCDTGFHVVVVDYGVKRNILRSLVDVGCRVTVVPAHATAAQIFAYAPDGVLLSNGPGDPAMVTYGIKTVQDLLGKVPLFGICLGHQLLALALGAKSYKLKFGHRGVNHPVLQLANGRVEITSQNHGFSIDAKTLPSCARVTHVNLNDQTLAGLEVTEQRAFSVQYHPEASPGPHDASYLFGQFVTLMAARA
jgi:carbamoyl-phosphate synthase small subunit